MLDLYTTLAGVLYFNARELNPIVSILLSFGLAPFVIFKIAFVYSWALCCELVPKKIRKISASPSIAMIAAISLSNSYVILSV